MVKGKWNMYFFIFHVPSSILHREERMKNFILIIVVLALGGAIGWFISEYNTQQNARPCIILEKHIMTRHGFQGQGESSVQVDYFRMYAELVEHGCPENKPEFKERFEEEMKKQPLRGVLGAAAEIRIDMDRVGRAVEEAVQPAVDAMINVFDRVKDTRINITVE
jgi:hypothetical protein